MIVEVIFVGTMTFLWGAAAGCIYKEKSIKEFYEKQYMEDYISMKKKHYKKVEKKVDEFEENVTSKQNDIKDKYIKLSSMYRPKDYVDPAEFESPQEDEGLPFDTPIIISEEEYLEDENMQEKVQFVYYMSDGVVADDNEDPLDDVDGVIGRHHLEKFEHSDDQIIYIRNAILSMDIEIVKNLGSYKELVLGEPNPIKEGRRPDAG